MRHIPRQSLILIFAAQAAAGYLPARLGWGVPIGDRATAGGIPPELPPGPFFAIWAVIFTAYLAFAIYALREDTDLSRTLTAPVTATGALNTLWMLSSQLIGNPLLDLLLIIPILVTSWWGAYRFDRMRDQAKGAPSMLADALTGLLAGWLTAATAISVPRAGRYLLNQGPTDSEWIALWSVLAVVSAGAYVFKRRISRSWWFYGAVGWGLIGVIVNNWTRTGFGYFGWIALVFGVWLVARRLLNPGTGALGAMK
ncbi:MAG: hypothetical protein AAGJ29_12820 [Pseudomonadota bacterium]